MTTNGVQPEDIITSYSKAPARTVSAGGVSYAYRELGPKGGIPVIFFVHLAATLDNWDPRIIDPIAQQHHVIAFDNRGVGASTGTVPDTIEVDGRRRVCLHHRTRFQHRRRLLLLPRRDGRPSAGGQTPQPGPQADPHRNRTRRRKGHRQGRRDNLLRHACVRPSPAATPRSSCSSTATTSASAPRAPSSNASTNAPQDRDAKISVKAFQTQLKAIKRWGRSTPADLSTITQPTLIANGDNDRMVPSVLSEDMHRRIAGSELIIYPNSGHGGIFQYHREFASAAIEFLDR